MGEEVTRMAKAISDETFHPDAFPGYKNFDEFKMGFDNLLEVYANVLSGNNANRSNVARTMRSMQIARKSTKGIEKILSDPGMFRDVEAKARALSDPANAGKPITSTVEKALAEVHGFMDRVNTFRINALLSGPGTQEVNLVSNVINSFVIPAEEFIGGLSKGDRAMMVHATRTIQGYMAGLMDSVKAVGQAGWWDDAILDPHSLKVDDNALRGQIFEPKLGNAALSTVDKGVKLPQRGLMTIDEFFKQSQYRGRVLADANAEATAKRLKGPEREAFIKKYLAESYDEAGAATRAMLSYKHAVPRLLNHWNRVRSLQASNRKPSSIPAFGSWPPLSGHLSTSCHRRINMRLSWGDCLSVSVMTSQLVVQGLLKREGDRC